MSKRDNLLPKNDIHRSVIHLDMDAFYASVEMRDNPDLAQKALVIAHDPREHNGHGVITTANYIARQYNVASAMPAIKAVQRIPADKLVFVKPNFEKYRAVSNQIHKIMHQISDQIEPVSLDEAYIDVTENKLGDYSAIELGNFLQEKIFYKTKLTSSFGVSYNKFLAKMASEYAKPFGKTIIRADEAIDFLAVQDVKKFPGVGKKMQQTLRSLGINTGKDLQDKSVEYLIDHFKKWGYYLALHSRGIDLSPVRASRQRKSIGKERTFEPVIFDEQKALSMLREYANAVCESLSRQNLKTACVVVKVRNRDFETVTRQKMLEIKTQDPRIVFEEAKAIFKDLPDFLNDGLRLLGLSVTNLSFETYEETSLFSTH